MYFDKYNPIFVAVIENNLTEVKRLVEEEGVNVDSLNPCNGNGTPLMTASLEGHLPIVDYFIEAGANVNHTCKANQTALIWAAESGHLHIVKRLVEANADIHHADVGETTALIMADHLDHHDVVEYLEQILEKAC